MSFPAYPPVSETRWVCAGSRAWVLREESSPFVWAGAVVGITFLVCAYPISTCWPCIRRETLKTHLKNLKSFNQVLTLKNKHMALGWHLLKFMVAMQKSSFVRDALEASRSGWRWDRPPGHGAWARSADPGRGGAAGI